MTTIEALVFPAYAGMSRPLSMLAYTRPSFPRLRGDEPYAAYISSGW